MKKILIPLFFSLVVFELKGQNLLKGFNPMLKGGVSPQEIGIQNDGKIIIGAPDLLTIGSEYVNGVARLNLDGTLDSTFHFDRVISFYNQSKINRILVLEDDKFFIAGREFLEDDPDQNLIKFNADGSIDSAFNLVISTRQVLDIIPIPNDQYIIAVNPVWPHAETLLKINSDGSLDESFIGTGPKDLGDVLSMALYDDKIIIGGFFTTFNETSVNKIVRINVDGSLDPTFNPGAGPDEGIWDLDIQSNGKIIIGGDFSDFSGQPTSNLIRLNVDGSVDDTFTVPAEVGNLAYGIDRIKVLQNDKIMVSGYKRILQLNANGTINGSFSIGGTNSDRNVSWSYLNFCETNSRLYVFGNFSYYNDIDRIGLVALDNSGSVLPFNAHLGGIPKIESIAVQDDGKVLVGGNIIEVDNQRVNNFVRLYDDGSLDKEFINNLGNGFNEAVLGIHIDLDGSIYVGGGFSSFNNQSRGAIVKLNSDGTLNSSFLADGINGANIDQGPQSIVEQGDYLILGGGFTAQDGSTAIRNFARVHANTGDLDTNFNSDDVFYSGSSFRENVTDVDMQSDGKIVVFGYHYNEEVAILSRFNPDGTVDDSFNKPEISGYHLCAGEVLFSDELVFGGMQANRFSPSFIVPIRRTDEDGGLITETAYGNKGGNLLDILEINSSELIIAGEFDEVGFVESRSLVKATLTSVYSDFNPGFGVNSSISEIAQFNDEQILVGGVFTSLQGRKKHCSLVAVTINNKKPVITAYNGDKIFQEDTEFELDFNLFTIEDDGAYPEDNIWSITEGSNYTFNGNHIIPEENYNGLISVNVTVNDGSLESEEFSVEIEIEPVNDPPVIVEAVSELTTSFETPIEITLSDLVIQDPDNTIEDFMISLQEGDNYLIDDNIVVPSDDFTGFLRVGVLINDGQLSSDLFELEIYVEENVQPVITAYNGDKIFQEDTEFELDFSLFAIEDDGINFEDYSLSIKEGSNFTSIGNQITPAENYNGLISVNVTVNDGNLESEEYSVEIEIEPVNDPPVIVEAVSELTTSFETPIEITLSDLVIQDPDNTIEDFMISLQEGDNYLIDDNIVVPSDDFTGFLNVGILVNDGQLSSELFELEIFVEEEVITGIENKNNSELTIFPNPVADIVTITGLQISEKESFILMDLSGKKINVGIYPVDSHSYQLDLCNLQTGNYFLSIKTSKGPIIKRIVKNH